MKLLNTVLILFLLTACSVSDYRSLAKAAVSEKPSKVFKDYVKRKTDYYIKHPEKINVDIKNFLNGFEREVQKFTKAISVWRNPEKPKRKKLVKYTERYKARAIIDFEKGYVRVESLSSDKKILLKALVNAMLMPEDPRSADLFDDKIKLGGRPFLAGQIYDFEHKPVLYRWRAERYAKWLVKNRLKNYIEKNQKIYYVTFNLVKNSENLRAKKYLPYVKESSGDFRISRTLVYAIIKTESDFNPYAVSYVPAFGLMQIVPTTAGVEGYERAFGYKKIPSRDFLFVPKNNIKIGTAYLNILFYKYLKKVKNPVSKEYCAIAAYNSGIGNVFRVFNIRRDRAFYIINSLSPKEVYRRLVMRLPSDEGRRYLPKVIEHKKEFIGY